ncbi:MAG TPA: hypothetical protein VE709_10835 [Pseudonocardiaceae bacterium]|nr:hypothetical protein [Pseudonocardiaceae bacterium]
MDTLAAPSERAALPGRTASGPHVTLWLLRAVVTLFVLAVLAQPVLAGLYLSGEFDALPVHAAIAGVVILLAMVLVGAALLFSTIGRGRFWPLPVAVAAFLAAGFQTGFGYARQLGLHIPLGVVIVTAAVLLAVAVWRPAMRRPRRPLWGLR